VLNFVKKKLKVPSNVQKVLVPFQYTNHWSVIVINVSHFMHYNPFKIANIFQFASVHLFSQKCGLLHKVNCQGHLDGSEHYQRIVGCGLMDHNNYLIGSVGFMS